MWPLSLKDNEVYGPIRGHLVLSVPNHNPMAAVLGEIAVLLVYHDDGTAALIYLTKEQTIELRDSLNTLLEEIKDNGRTLSE